MKALLVRGRRSKRSSAKTPKPIAPMTATIATARPIRAGCTFIALTQPREPKRECESDRHDEIYERRRRHRFVDVRRDEDPPHDERHHQAEQRADHPRREIRTENVV